MNNTDQFPEEPVWTASHELSLQKARKAVEELELQKQRTENYQADEIATLLDCDAITAGVIYSHRETLLEWFTRWAVR